MVIAFIHSDCIRNMFDLPAALLMPAGGVDLTDLPEAKSKYPPCPPSLRSYDKIMFLLYLNMKNHIFFHFGLYWPSTAFVGLY